MELLQSIVISAAIGISSIAAGLAAFEQSQPATEQFQKLQEELRVARAKGDTASYLGSARRMHDFLNGSPASVLQLMSTQAFAGELEEALDSLTQFVHMGQSNEQVLQAKQFDALRGMPQYAKIHAAMVSNAGATSFADKAFSLPGSEPIPEDIDYDPETKLFYVTSVLNKEIFSIDEDGRTMVFAKTLDYWPMMAVKIDAHRRILWATEVAIDGFTSSPRKDWGRSAIVMYDLKSGKLIRRVEGPAHTALGDLTLTGDGDPIVSDGDHGGVYRVSRLTGQIARLDAGDFISPQTPAMLPDGLHLLVPDYLRGIGILDLGTKRVSWFPMEDAHALSGIDGLYIFGRTLIAIQNGATPERVVRFELNASLSRVESESILERATPTLGDPTHGVVVDGFFYYIANSGWDALDEHGNCKPGVTMPRSAVMRAQLLARTDQSKPLDRK
jgi:hypothetical protein